jgi:hypothetical protein
VGASTSRRPSRPVTGISLPLRMRLMLFLYRRPPSDSEKTVNYGAGILRQVEHIHKGTKGLGGNSRFHGDVTENFLSKQSAEIYIHTNLA